MDANVNEWLNLIFRWIHVLAGVMSFFICSRRKNTRIRFCAVGVTVNFANEAFSARSIADLSPPCFSQRSISA